MVKLRDLVNVDINRNSVMIQGVSIPVIFTFTSFPYVEEAYGKTYVEFEKDLNVMLKKSEVVMGKKESHLMQCLIYAMIRSGGTECTFEEIEGAIPLTDLPNIFQVALDIFNNQNFQKEDMERIKQEKKSETY